MIDLAEVPGWTSSEEGAYRWKAWVELGAPGQTDGVRPADIRRVGLYRLNLDYGPSSSPSSSAASSRGPTSTSTTPATARIHIHFASDCPDAALFRRRGMRLPAFRWRPWAATAAARRLSLPPALCSESRFPPGS